MSTPRSPDELCARAGLDELSPNTPVAEIVHRLDYLYALWVASLFADGFRSERLSKEAAKGAARRALMQAGLDGGGAARLIDAVWEDPDWEEPDHLALSEAVEVMADALDGDVRDVPLPPSMRRRVSPPVGE